MRSGHDPDADAQDVEVLIGCLRGPNTAALPACAE
jgi:hypothetical protein